VQTSTKKTSAACTKKEKGPLLNLRMFAEKGSLFFGSAPEQEG
jgi:hypothetical protein